MNALTWIDIREYGALPDSDPLMDPVANRAAIAAALAAVPTGGVCYVPPSTFVITGEALEPKPSTSLVGATMRGSVILQETLSQEVLKMNIGTGEEKAFFGLRDLGLLHHYPQGPAPIVRLENVSLLNIERCQFKYGAFGLHVTGQAHAHVRGCYANEQYGDGIVSAGFYFDHVRQLQLAHCFTTEQEKGALGYLFTDCEATEVVQCNASDTFDNSGFKITGNGYCAVSFHGCQAVNCGGNGHGAADGFEVQTASHVHLSNCRAVNNGRHGFYVRNSAYVSFTGCQALNNGRWGAGNGWYVLNSTDVGWANCLATDTQTPKTQQNGIEGAGSTDRMAVVGNISRQNAGTAIILAGGASVAANNLTT